MIRVVLSL